MCSVTLSSAQSAAHTKSIIFVCCWWWIIRLTADVAPSLFNSESLIGWMVVCSLKRSIGKEWKECFFKRGPIIHCFNFCQLLPPSRYRIAKINWPKFYRNCEWERFAVIASAGQLTERKSHKVGLEVKTVHSDNRTQEKLSNTQRRKSRHEETTRSTYLHISVLVENGIILVGRRLIALNWCCRLHKHVNWP